MDTLIKAFEKRNFKVEMLTDKETETCVFIHDEKLRFTLSEKQRQIDKSLAENKKNNDESRSWIYPRYDYKPTDILTLRIDEWGVNGLQKSWSDGKAIKLEDKLNDFVIGAVRFAIVNREERLTRQKEWGKQRKKEAEERQRRLFVENFINNIEKDAESWAKTQMLRSYIREVEKKVVQRLDRHTFQEEYEKWLSMANQYIEQLDPFTKGLPFESSTVPIID